MSTHLRLTASFFRSTIERLSNSVSRLCTSCSARLVSPSWLGMEVVLQSHRNRRDGHSNSNPVSHLQHGQYCSCCVAASAAPPGN